MKDIPVNPELAKLLEESRNHVMTDEERKAQRESWLRGEMGMGTDADEEEYKRQHGF